MPNTTLFVAGIIHQGHRRFRDQILTQGDSMYLTAFERQTIPDTEISLKINRLVNSAILLFFYFGTFVLSEMVSLTHFGAGLAQNQQ